jgi:hypothetical protein
MRDRCAQFCLNSLTLKKLLTEFIEKNAEAQSFLSVIRNKYESPDSTIPLFEEAFKNKGFNVALGIDFANTLQLLTDRKNFDAFDLIDISRLFESLLKLQDYNLETYVEAANFEWRVMDNSEKAKSIILEGLKKAKQKADELDNLLKAITEAK